MIQRSRSGSGQSDKSWRDRGYAVVLTALILVPLFGFAGFAVDVGFWYARASSLQKAADAASLAGVVWQPNLTAAEAAARDIASQNGFTHGVDGIQVLVTDTGANQLQVEIVDTDTDLFFAGLFLSNVTIGRRATAEYNEPVAMGSPDNTLGQQMPAGCYELIMDDGSTCSGPGPHPGFFLDVGGPLGPHTGGEAFTTQCLTGYGGSCDFSNPEYDINGYLFAIDVPESGVGSPITVEIFDPSHAQWAGKEIPLWYDGASQKTVLEFSVFDADGIGITTPTTTPLAGCTQTFDGVYDAAEAAQWVTICTFTPTKADIYPLRVRSDGFAGANASGITQDGWSMRATSTGTDPSVFALEFLPLLSNAPTATQFTFAEIVEDHAGKTIRMRLFDAGDGAGTNYTLTPLDPSGAPVPTCQYRHYFANEDPATKPWLPSDDPSVCAVDTKVGGTSLYNDKWVDIDIDIPTTYTCGAWCWWSVDYDTGGAAFYERTVWAVVIIGDPVRLVE